MVDDLVKCANTHCKHESRELPRDSATRVGKRYMHGDCAIKNTYVQKVRDLYYEEVSDTVVIKNLVATINNIVYKKNVDAEYLYFALSHAIVAKIPIKSPYSLHYLVDNDRIKKLWEKKKSEKIMAEMSKEEEDPDLISGTIQKSTFKYSNSNNTGFGNILKGGK